MGPPVIIDFARVVGFAQLNPSVRPTGRHALHSPELAGRLGGIALCERLLADETGFFIALCDAEWNLLTKVQTVSPEIALQTIEESFHGILDYWLATSVTIQQANAWLYGRQSRTG